MHNYLKENSLARASFWLGATIIYMGFMLLLLGWGLGFTPVNCAVGMLLMVVVCVEAWFRRPVIKRWMIWLLVLAAAALIIDYIALDHLRHDMFALMGFYPWKTFTRPLFGSW